MEPHKTTTRRPSTEMTHPDNHQAVAGLLARASTLESEYRALTCPAPGSELSPQEKTAAEAAHLLGGPAPQKTLTPEERAQRAAAIRLALEQLRHQVAAARRAAAREIVEACGVREQVEAFRQQLASALLQACNIFGAAEKLQVDLAFYDLGSAAGWPGYDRYLYEALAKHVLDLREAGAQVDVPDALLILTGRKAAPAADWERRLRAPSKPAEGTALEDFDCNLIIE